jgi:GNAT superfamily N-acetyltransferase
MIPALKANQPGMQPLTIRPMHMGDIEALSGIWFAGWQDAHTGLLPAKLARLRTRDSFRDRLAAAVQRTCVATWDGHPIGLSIRDGSELNQFYVAATARGTGVAQALMAETFECFRAAQVPRAWLACAIGNNRAARFYEKTGWARVSIVETELATPEGPFALNVWRYEFDLRDRDPEASSS